MSTYVEQLKDPRWQRRRLERLELAEWSCESCGAEEKTLHVHHPVYIKGRKPWQYDDDGLQVLCDECHADYHAAEAVVKRFLASNSEYSGILIGIIAGYLDVDGAISDEDKAEMMRAGCWIGYQFGARL